MGLILQLDESTMRGGFADVFPIDSSRRVVKLYQSGRHPEVRGHEGLIEDHLRTLHFEAELKAFQVVKENSELHAITPSYWGRPSIDAVFFEGDEISDHYLMACALEMDFIEGSDRKYHPVIRRQFPNVEQLLHEYDIKYTIDMSAFIHGDMVTLIDFSTSNAYTDEEMRLLNNGTIA